jgi:hypothetical protein
MKSLKIALVAACAMLTAPTLTAAREPGTPFVMSSGASSGVPVGANPPPGLYFSSRSELVFGHIYDPNGDALNIDVDASVMALQLHWVPGFEILGGSYRAMINVPMGNVRVDSFGSKSSTTGVGDVVIAPLNLSWMLQPGVFVQSGISFNLPLGKFDTAAGSVNTGTGAFATALDLGVSYLRDGWNLSAHVNYFMHATNPDTDYRSGDELLVNWTAMKDLGGFSLGPVGYYRRQMTDDVNKGSAYGGTVSGRIEQSGLGLGFTKRFGPRELNINVIKNIHSSNGVGQDKIMINFTLPLGAPG